jgi:hypothetical protein
MLNMLLSFFEQFDDKLPDWGLTANVFYQELNQKVVQYHPGKKPKEGSYTDASTSIIRQVNLILRCVIDRTLAAPSSALCGFLPIVAIAHSVFATSCELNSPDIASARRSSCPISRSSGFVPIVANAHSVFAICCELNYPDIAFARPSIDNRKGLVVLYLFLTIMWRTFAICCESWEIHFSRLSCMYQFTQL